MINVGCPTSLGMQVPGMIIYGSPDHIGFEVFDATGINTPLPDVYALMQDCFSDVDYDDAPEAWVEMARIDTWRLILALRESRRNIY